jgi:hypothetical protein
MKKIRYIIIFCLIAIGFQSQAELIEDGLWAAWFSIQTDTQGNPHVIYYHPSSDVKLVYAYKDGSWQKEFVDSTRAVGGGETSPNISLALDSNDRPGIAYWRSYAGVPENLVYAHKPGSSWQITPLREGRISWPTLRYSSTTPIIVYYLAQDSNPYIYIGLPEQSITNWDWDSTAIEKSAAGSKTLDFIWDDNNKAQILYVPAFNHNAERLVRWLTWNNTIWSGKQTLESTGELDHGIHMAKSRNGVVGAAYIHGYRIGAGIVDSIHYTTHIGTNWNVPQVIDRIAAPDNGPPLAYDTLNQPHLVYVSNIPNSGETPKLMHAWKQGQNWRKEVLRDSFPASPPRIELAIDKYNRLHIAYVRDINIKDLYYLEPFSYGVNERKDAYPKIQLQVFGNLSISPIRFSLQGAQNAKVAIFDVLGNLVDRVEIQDGSAVWYGSNISKGIYFAQLAENHNEITKIVKLW